MKNTRNMKKKIDFYLLFTVSLTLLATLIMAVAIFHYMYREQVINDMETYARLLRAMAGSGGQLRENDTDPGSGLRVTVVAPDGTVVFDSEAQEDVLGNHGDRPEIQSARQDGSAYSIRHSDTLNRDMYYYALKLDNGDVLRISREAASIWSVFTMTMACIVGIGVLMFGLCLVLSHYITRSIVRPIEKLAEDIDRVGEIEMYEELVPFVTTIQKQHADIIKGAKMRQEFTANVSHELKTPLTSISGYAELIETGLAGENEVQHFAKEIHRNARRLLRLINDIIRLSELDSDQTELSLAPVDLCEIAQSCVNTLKINAENNGITITCSGIPRIVHADHGMMEELLYNLCDNAIRYNRPGGTVHVIVGVREGKTVLSVQDTGIGIPKDSQERVFERFYRVDKSRSKLTGGTGLGLAIVKHIIAQHHAVLTLHSEEGEGTEITVVFPEQSQ